MFFLCSRTEALVKTKKQTGPTTHYICQLYEERRVGKSGKALAIKVAIPYPNAGRAEERAERSFKAGHCVGADAYSVAEDTDTGETDEPVFLARHGKVPEVDAF